jgi:hypothetical protein
MGYAVVGRALRLPRVHLSYPLDVQSNSEANSCERFFQFFRQLGLLIFESMLPRNFFL